jgi:hypothetical protein
MACTRLVFAKGGAVIDPPEPVRTLLKVIMPTSFRPIGAMVSKRRETWRVR